MKKFSSVLLLTAALISIVGCGKGSPKAPHTARTSRIDPIDQEEKDIETNAQRAKASIDAMKADAEDALQRTRQSLKNNAGKHSNDFSEIAAEATEDAKDRAEDLPQQIDQAIQQRTDDLRARIRKRLEAEQKAIREEAAEDADR